MKSILMSIQPKWCELIASGKKTIEVRRTKPKLATPFKVYIYETQGRTETPWIDEDGHHIFKGRGQVIGEFICDWIEPYWFTNDEDSDDIEKYEDVQLSCLAAKEIIDYGQEKELYFYHIFNLVIYDKPKRLTEFCVTDNDAVRDCDCRHIVGQPEYKTAHNGWIKGGYYCTKNDDWCSKCKTKPLTRPPQSWCCVEENSH